MSFFGTPALTLDLRGGATACRCCCSKAANGLLSFLGGGSETGVYADPTGLCSSSLAGISNVAGLGEDAERYIGGDWWEEKALNAGRAMVGKTGTRSATGGAGGGEGTEGFSSGHASAGVVGVTDPDVVPYSEAAEAAGRAAPNVGRGADGAGGGLAAIGTDEIGVARSAAMSTFPTGL